MTGQNLAATGSDLVPLALLPVWAQSIGAWTPFPSTFGFPIDTLAGDLDGAALARGLGVQLLWVLIGWGLVRLIWPWAVRRYGGRPPTRARERR